MEEIFISQEKQAQKLLKLSSCDPSEIYLKILLLHEASYKEM